MSSRSTLVFLCDNPKLYDDFIAELEFAGFELLLARNFMQARSQLLRRRPVAVVIRHDGVADDRALAPKLKAIDAKISVFLLTDQEQPVRQPGVDAVWRGDFSDNVIARGMAVLFDRHLAPSDGKESLQPLATAVRAWSLFQTRPTV